MSGPSLSARLRESTQPAHTVAERSGIMRDLLQGHVRRDVYCLLLRNLHCLYERLEDALDDHSASPLVAPVRFPALYRAGPLRLDLDSFHGTAWTSLPVTNAMETYVRRIQDLSDTRPECLSAHAYIRYMGDLSGGQILGRIVTRSLGLTGGNGTAFYQFGGSVKALELKSLLRAGLDRLPISGDQADAIVNEANEAFALHVQLFQELDGPDGEDVKAVAGR